VIIVLLAKFVPRSHAAATLATWRMVRPRASGTERPFPAVPILAVVARKRTFHNGRHTLRRKISKLCFLRPTCLRSMLCANPCSCTHIQARLSTQRAGAACWAGGCSPTVGQRRARTGADQRTVALTKPRLMALSAAIVRSTMIYALMTGVLQDGAKANVGRERDRVFPVSLAVISISLTRDEIAGELKKGRVTALF
jgi:hypothetical protein